MFRKEYVMVNTMEVQAIQVVLPVDNVGGRVVLVAVGKLIRIIVAIHTLLPIYVVVSVQNKDWDVLVYPKEDVF